MDDINFYTLLFLAVAGFLAAFIDSVVGGGGLISIPALLFTGLPPISAIATNKLASSMGALTSTISFIRSGKVHFPLVRRLVPLTILGAVFGTFVVKYIASEILKPLVLILLVVVAIYTIMKKNWGNKTTYTKLTAKKKFFFPLTVFIIGFYDGFFGAGTGSFLLFAFLIIGFDFVESAGNAKILNFCSNITALLLFLYLGEVQFTYGIVMGIFMVLGAFIGSQFAIKKGVSYVKILFLTVTLFLIGKNIFDYIQI
ncbi:sulfite exporter TauE/SafE family protein [Shimazuella kribbensis]|uniref:sulfite exporter TauE/SafE family protein n=1 Tax=Shimazuella kribbensis TaxID=139808 RepID=UPI0004274DE0|nr:TSUP family transporter [Shimazuella kribbensis]